MELPIDKKTHLRHVISFLYFENKHDPKRIHERITNVYGDNFCSLNDGINWIKNFKNDDYSFKDKLRFDVTPLGFHLFRSMGNQMRGGKFKMRKSTSLGLIHFLHRKIKISTKEDLKKWFKSVTKNKGEYVLD